MATALATALPPPPLKKPAPRAETTRSAGGGGIEGDRSRGGIAAHRRGGGIAARPPKKSAAATSTATVAPFGRGGDGAAACARGRRRGLIGHGNRRTPDAACSGGRLITAAAAAVGRRGERGRGGPHARSGERCVGRTADAGREVPGINAPRAAAGGQDYDADTAGGRRQCQGRGCVAAISAVPAERKAPRPAGAGERLLRQIQKAAGRAADNVGHDRIGAVSTAAAGRFVGTAAGAAASPLLRGRHADHSARGCTAAGLNGCEPSIAAHVGSRAAAAPASVGDGGDDYRIGSGVRSEGRCRGCCAGEAHAADIVESSRSAGGVGNTLHRGITRGGAVGRGCGHARDAAVSAASANDAARCAADGSGFHGQGGTDRHAFSISKDRARGPAVSRRARSGRTPSSAAIGGLVERQRTRCGAGDDVAVHDRRGAISAIGAPQPVSARPAGFRGDGFRAAAVDGKGVNARSKHPQSARAEDTQPAITAGRAGQSRFRHCLQ